MKPVRIRTTGMENSYVRPMANEPQPEVSVRRLSPSDAEAFRPLRLEALKREPQAFGETSYEEAVHPLSWFADRLKANLIFGAFIRGQLVGIVCYFVRPEEKLRHKATLGGFFVSPSARRSGVATALLNRAIEEARAREHELRLAVAVVNEPACRLYLKNGFSVYGTEPRSMRIGDRFYDEFLMSRPAEPLVSS